MKEIVIETGGGADQVDDLAQLHTDLNTGSGGDSVLAEAGSRIQKAFLGSGNDRYDGRSASVTRQVWGGRGADVLLGGFVDEALYGGGGDDHLLGKLGDDFLDGGGGFDRCDGGGDKDRAARCERVTKVP